MDTVIIKTKLTQPGQAPQAVIISFEAAGEVIENKEDITDTERDRDDDGNDGGSDKLSDIPEVSTSMEFTSPSPKTEEIIACETSENVKELNCL